MRMFAEAGETITLGELPLDEPPAPHPTAQHRARQEERNARVGLDIRHPAFQKHTELPLSTPRRADSFAEYIGLQREREATEETQTAERPGLLAAELAAGSSDSRLGFQL